MNSITSTITILLSLLTIVLSPVHANMSPPPPGADYNIHALYIFNFTKYVEWPSSGKNIKIGVVDSSGAEEQLQKMIKATQQNGSSLSVINTRSDAELGSCQIIFIPSNNSHLASKLIERFKTQPILIVTEDADLVKKGASISFKISSGKLRFQINEETIKASGLKVSSSLISLAER